MEYVDSNVDLEELELDMLEDATASKTSSEEITNPLEYPCAVISGITTTHEVEFLKNHVCDAEVSLPLYIDYDGLIMLLGKIELTLDYMLLLKCMNIAEKYSLSIHKSKASITSVDLNDPLTLMKFIRIW